VLLKVTEILRKELRGNDLVARWTGTSFIIMLPATTGIAASRTFDRIFQSLSQPLELEQYSVVLNLDPHIGGSVYSDQISAQELIHQAENSIEQARRGNGDTKQIYVWEMKKPFWAPQPQEPEATEA
jgi:diguanylate cyclase (GGDEF)-like protein